MITVQGHSMEPTYHPGDLVLIDAGAEPEIGQIVVFQIPQNELGGGSLVVHRLIGRRADGTYITQGDNTQSPDTFLTTRSDILGAPRFAIPHGGRAIAFLSTPLGLAAATGGLLTLLLWPRKKSDEPTGTEVVERPVVVEVPVVDEPGVDEDGWSSSTLPDQLVAEAEAWLQSQLASLSQSL